ncbi:MAG: V-type ATPase subunit [Spirochaetes bacterium]|nr:V-type ATPase subunit [Spirochaetota bacterium]
MYFFANIMYVHGKIHALFNNLFRKKEYIDLINSRNFNSLFPDLQKDITGEKFTIIKEVLFRHQIEKLIILTSASKDYHQLFKMFLRLYELNNIKIMLAKSFKRNNLIEQWHDIHPYHTFDRNLIHTDLNPENFYKIIKDTYIQNIFSPGKKSKYEIIESKLDYYIAESILVITKSFYGLNRKIYREFITRKLIITRLIWRERLYHNYKWPEKKVKKIDNKFFKHLFKSISSNKIKDIILLEIDQNLHKTYEKTQTNSDDLIEVEYKLDQYFRRYVYKNFHSDFHHIYSVISYLLLLQYQIENINKIIEGFRCNADPEILINKIICEE